MKIVEIYKCDTATRAALPLYLSKVRAGFPSPAEDYSDYYFRTMPYGSEKFLALAGPGWYIYFRTNSNGSDFL